MLRTEVIRPVSELVTDQAARLPARVALSDDARTVTYRELADRTASLAVHLAVSGVRRGDRVLLLIGNGVALVESYLAVTRAEAIAVCLNAASTSAEVAFAVRDCRPSVIITDGARAETVAAVLDDHEGLPPVVIVDRPIGSSRGDRHVTSLEQAATGHPGACPPDSLPMHDPAWMLYTSGTTGRPKGVLLSQHSMMWVVAAAWLPFLDLTGQDVVLNPLPLSHSYPLDFTLAALAVGARQHILERFSARTVIDALTATNATVLLCVPTTQAYLLAALDPPDTDGGAPFPSLRFCIAAGAILSAELAQQTQLQLGVPILDAYGSTEASTVIAMNSDKGTRVPGSCGVPALGWAVRLVDPDTGIDVPFGSEGELIARSPGVMLGYFERPEETANTLRDGWYWTGDLARQDENGYLTITGRVNDIINRGGEKLAPAEIEHVAMTHPSIIDCAVAPRPDTMLGQVPVLFAVQRTDAPRTDPAALTAWCAQRLPPYKVPAEVHLIPEIPKTASGKIKRHLLKPPPAVSDIAQP